MKQHFRKYVAVLLVAFTATACTISQNKDYHVDLSISGVYMHIHKDMSHAISNALWVNVCHADARCLGNWLHDNVKISGWGAAEWYTATRYYGDLANNVGIVYSHPNKCLVLHKDPWGGLNWQTANC